MYFKVLANILKFTPFDAMNGYILLKYNLRDSDSIFIPTANIYCIFFMIQKRDRLEVIVTEIYIFPNSI